jgi:glucokinase
MSNPPNKVIIALDLGGTRIRVARLDERLNILMRQETLTLAEQGFEPVMGRLQDLIQQALPQDGAPVTGIGVAVPGPVNPATGLLFSAENLPGWDNVPVVNILQERFGLPVFLGNDANVAALAETVLGAARGCQNVIYLTISTGIGGGIVADGKLLLGHEGLAAEAGWMFLVIDNGQPVILQDRASGLAMGQQARERLARGEPSLMRTLVNGQLDRVDGKIVGLAAQHSDALALDIVHGAARLIGVGVASLVHLFSPEMIVIGGGVSALDELLFAPVRQTVKAIVMPPYWDHLRIEPAALGEDVGLIGAAALVVTGGGLGNIADISARLGPNARPIEGVR